ncbi:hypothetical protein FHR92_002580 [Fontibacillus solani]|uniref:Uncharacterized protein n=2 Tax=Fontibacillus TaxID=995014 RepID=A0A1G7EZH3_9BACL|nr:MULTISPECIES: hypothetical protein [Fontibacillus]MBA9086107.1 hypothetical protein [Fontibacillus solani]SDE69071.1 hypothetical protein SAMN04488542_101403 [Fontibacillus panacisegetis]
MTGKMRYCLLFGFIGFLISFAVSAGNNLFSTSLFRGIIAFVVWFVLSFAVYWVIGFLKELPPDLAVEEMAALQAQDGKGTNLDLMTPDESEELNDLLKQPPSSQSQAQPQDFAPLNPPKLVKTPDDKDPVELANVVRHLTEN